MYSDLTALGVSPETADEITQACRGDELMGKCAILAAQGMTQEETAEALGIGQQRVSDALGRIRERVSA